MKTQWIYIWMVITSVMLSGCGTATNKSQYMLDISPPHTAKVLQPSSAIIEVRTFAIDSEFSGRQMVYRIDEFRYAPDYYNEFYVPPAMMITQAVKNWLADAELFARVLEPGSTMAPTCVLSGSIVACYADIRDKAAPAAVLELRMFLTKQDKGAETLVWSRKYEIREPMKDTRAESFAAAMSRCVQTVLQKLLTDLAEQAR
jgi:cholesterol transport system auxiliary component